KEYLGSMPDHFFSHRCEDLVCVGRDVFTVNCNWKLLLENALEDYHTPSVHRASIGSQTAIREPTSGQWESLYVSGDAPVGMLPGEISPFPRISGLSERAENGSYFTIIYPNTQFCFTQDSMWWLSVSPLSAAKCSLELGYCFPRDTTERKDFGSIAPRYFHRWKVTAQEDTAISELQQKGL